MKYTVIGISDSPNPFFPPEIIDIISKGKVFSGGKRHHRIVACLLPHDSQWIDITVPLNEVFEKYNHCDTDEIVVFASGDPLFYGFANTINRMQPDAEITMYPSFNSLQLLAHRLVMPYHDMHVVSLTGRDWPAFDQALISCMPKIGILTDKVHTPSTIARRMIEYGYTDYQMYVGESLGNPDEEKVYSLHLDEAAEKTFQMPNCLIVVGNHRRIFGIPDHKFDLLEGREKMITKMPIRLLALQQLDLADKRVFWDVGFCTGSVSIEAKLLFPHLHVEAFEIREEGRELMHVNSRKFGAPGINAHIGDFILENVDGLDRPDAVFIGGHGGRLKEIMKKIYPVLHEGGCVVMNSVTSAVVEQATNRVSSKELFDTTCRALGLKQVSPLRISLNNYNPIEILKCIK